MIIAGSIDCVFGAQVSQIAGAFGVQLTFQSHKSSQGAIVGVELGNNFVAYV
jgi:hypothetical protein